MTKEKLIEIFFMFFPNKLYSYNVVHSNEESYEEVYSIENGVKYVVNYDKLEDHLNVHTIAQYSYEGITYIEGSPEDIIKLSKLLQ